VIELRRSAITQPLPRRSWISAALEGARAWVAAHRAEAAPFAVVTAIALVLRLVDITGRPLHHDESEHAWFAWQFVTGHGYHYDPVFHGPVQFYLISAMYMLFGVSDWVVRLAPALVGTTLTALPFFLRRQLGMTAALIASVIFCLSPSYLYFSRFAREDIYAACVTLALLVVVFRFLAKPHYWHPALLLGLLAASFATKETTYITIFIAGTFFVGVLLWQMAETRGARKRLLDAPLLRSILSVGRDAWAWGVATFLIVYTLLFSTFFTNPHGLREGMFGSINYWLSQQPVNRGGQPWFYYLILAPGYEWPVVLLGLLGVASVIRKPTLLGAFLVWMLVLSFAVYSWASERMPWLVLHPLLPLVLLAGLGGQLLWRSRRRVIAKVGIAVAVLGAAYSLESAFLVTYVRPADPRELLVQVQTSTDVPKIRDEIMALERQEKGKTGQPLSLEVDSWGGTGWPWSWYLRDVPAGYPDMSLASYVPTGQVVLVADPNHDVVAPKLHDYVGSRFRLRVWWVPDWAHASAADWARWLLWRKTWSPTATMDEWIYVRKNLVPLPLPSAQPVPA
jgi:uncharacterized protein (TIGR03663 family)